jgi:hypothetical protein
MAAVDGAAEPSPPTTGLRLGPAGIAAVAVGAAAVTAVVIALFAAAKPTQQVPTPANSGAGTVAASASGVATTPTNASVDAVRAAIQLQVQAGQLSASDANDLSGRLNDIDRNLARGRVDQAAQKINDLRNRLQNLRDDNKIAEAGYNAILTALDQLGSALPQGGDNNGND